LLANLLLASLFCLSPSASAGSGRTPFVQVDILRVAPDDSAAFVPIAMPLGSGAEPEVEVLSRHGEWEEVRLHFRFKYNASSDPQVCAMSLYQETFSGFRKVEP